MSKVNLQEVRGHYQNGSPGQGTEEDRGRLEGQACLTAVHVRKLYRSGLYFLVPFQFVLIFDISKTQRQTHFTWLWLCKSGDLLLLHRNLGRRLIYLA